MEGGIKAWEGLVAEGVPESGMAYFSPATKPEDLIALAWSLEDGSRKFYSELAGSVGDQEAKNLLSDLAAAEQRHQASLLKLYKEFSGKLSDSEFMGPGIIGGEEGDVMEGGIRVSEALQWAHGKSLAEILDFSISLEANSYDLYVKMERHMEDQQSARLFYLLSGEEKQHLQRLSSLLEKRM
jgi:rubrerythrin